MRWYKIERKAESLSSYLQQPMLKVRRLLYDR